METKDIFKRQYAFYYIDDGKLMVLARMINSMHGGCVYGFLDWMSPLNPSKYMSKTKEGTISQAQEDNRIIYSTFSLYKTLKKTDAMPAHEKKIERRIQHWIMWPIIFLGIAVCIAFRLPVDKCILISFGWFGLMIFIAERIVEWVLKAK
jgi:hypothetical protein